MNTLDISDCGLINLEVLFVSETNKGYELAFDLVRFRTSKHLSCGGIVSGRLGQMELSSIYELGRRVLDKHEGESIHLGRLSGGDLS
jgi:hypothetical protein